MKGGRLGHALTPHGADRQALGKAGRSRFRLLLRTLATRGLRHLRARGRPDLFKVMDMTRHREVKTLKTYDRRAKAFRDHAGKGFL